MRRFDAEQQILNENHGHAHIHIIELRHIRHLYKAELHHHGGKAFVLAAAERIGVVAREAAHKQLIEQHPHMLRRTTRLHTVDHQELARGPSAHGRAAFHVVQLVVKPGDRHAVAESRTDAALQTA